jgi:uncharacterized membrane protein YphA (DoxX/SURF4 family)
MDLSDGGRRRRRQSADPNVRAMLLFAAAVVGVVLAIMLAVGVWPDLGDVGAKALITVNAILAATMTAVGVALYRRRS